MMTQEEMNEGVEIFNTVMAFNNYVRAVLRMEAGQ